MTDPGPGRSGTTTLLPTFGEEPPENEAARRNLGAATGLAPPQPDSTGPRGDSATNYTRHDPHAPGGPPIAMGAAMIETVLKGMPDTVAHGVAVMTAASAAVADHLPAGTLNVGGALALVAFTYFALQRGLLVTRREHEDVKKQRHDMQEDRDKWQSIALKALGVAEKVTDAAEVLTTPDPTKETP